jgi:hypothetical protein
VYTKGEIVIRTVEGVIDEHGNVCLLGPIRLPSVRRALVTILEDRPAADVETALLSEPTLAEDWSRTEGDEAWSFLNQMR